MAGIAPVVTVLVIMAAVATVNAAMAILKTVPMTIAVQSPGLVMVLQIVKTRLMAVISPAMIMMAATAKAVVAVVAVKTVIPVNMILPRTALNAAIPHGMNLVLTVPHWKATTTGIAQAVNAQVTAVAVVVVTAAMAI